MNDDLPPCPQPERLAEPLRGRVATWEQCFASRDVNSCCQQAITLVWDLAVYNLVLKTRELAPRNTRGELRLNGPIHVLFDRCFFDAQASRIRRLLDPSVKPPSHPKGTYSLAWLLADMLAASERFTRLDFFAMRSLSLDIDGLKRYEDAKFRASRSSGQVVRLSIGESPHAALDAHNDFDLLAGRIGQNRNPDDMIGATFFRRLQDRLATAREVCEYVNKYVAHAASRESRQQAAIENPRVDLDHLFDAAETICRVGEVLSMDFFGRQQFWMPMYQGDVFEHLDQPECSLDLRSELEKAWREWSMRVRQWSYCDASWLHVEYAEGRRKG